MRRNLISVAAVAAAVSLGSVQAAWAKSNTFESYGDVFKIALPLAGAALALEQGDTEGLKQFAVSGALTMGATYALKYSVDSTRPNGGPHSFPSGHTAAAFTGAAFIHQRYGWQWGIPAEIAAAAVAVSRIDAKAHHWRDVIASATLAHISAYALVDPVNDRVRLTPWAGGPKSSFGLAGRIRF